MNEFTSSTNFFPITFHLKVVNITSNMSRPSSSSLLRLTSASKNINYFDFNSIKLPSNTI